MADLAAARKLVNVIRTRSPYALNPEQDEALFELLRVLEECQRWGRQVHDALDGRPLPELPDEAPARIKAALDALEQRERQLQEQDQFVYELRARAVKAEDALEAANKKFASWHDVANAEERAGAAEAERDEARRERNEWKRVQEGTALESDERGARANRLMAERDRLAEALTVCKRAIGRTVMRHGYPEEAQADLREAHEAILAALASLKEVEG